MELEIQSELFEDTIVRVKKNCNGNSLNFERISFLDKREF